MEKRIVVTGSIAYDHLMRFQGNFSDEFRDVDFSNLSLAFLAMDRAVYFGGCAGNVCYNLALLGKRPIVAGSVGTDFASYEDWMRNSGIITDYVLMTGNHLTASAFILTDDLARQIVFFSPEAMRFSGNYSFIDKILDDSPISVVLVAPEMPERMLLNVKDCKKHGIAYVFDPGQNLHAFVESDLREAILGAKVLILNDFEMGVLRTKFGLDENKVVQMADFLIVTRGEAGAEVFSAAGNSKIAAVKAKNVVDPTGCGDAFRAGVLKALDDGGDLLDGCNLGAAIATINLGVRGTQNHTFTLNQLARMLIQ